MLPGQLDYVIVEWIAGEIMTWHPAGIPVLLQTPDYARAAATAAGTGSGAELEPLLAAQAARQAVVLGPERQLLAVIGEAALRQQTAPAEVMAAQLDHLAGLADRCANLTIQVLPLAANAAAGSAYSILRFPAVPSLGVVSLPTLAGHAHLEDHESLTRYLRAFGQQRAAALSPADTTALLRSIASELRPPWD